MAKRKVVGKKARPRLSVYRSNKFIYAQVIDDEKGITLAEAHGSDPVKIGSLVSKIALAKKVTEVVFDRSGRKYHGRVKALANAAREGGLKF